MMNRVTTLGMMSRRLEPPALDALPEERLIQSGQADEPIDNSGESRDLTERQAEERRHEIDARHRHEPPVQRTDDDQHRGNDIEQFHRILLARRLASRLKLTLVQIDLLVSKIAPIMKSHVNEVTVLARNVTDVQTEERQCCLQPCGKA